MKFYLGTHSVHWLRFSSVPLFISMRRLRLYGTSIDPLILLERQRKSTYKPWPRAVCTWALDSGGFSELLLYGKWKTSAAQYCLEVDRAIKEVGEMDWAAIQDWMCEDIILQKTGLPLIEHQALTVKSYLDLKKMRPSYPWTPVLQGFKLEEYKRCFQMYKDAGIDLVGDKSIPVVGIGSICRREGTAEAEEIIRYFAGLGVRIHAFGFKTEGIRDVGNIIQSADSLAWSHGARHRPPLPGHLHAHCNNCYEYALRWRQKVLGIRDEAAIQEALRKEGKPLAIESGEDIAYRLLFGDNK